MHKHLVGCVVTAALALPVAAYPSTESDIAELKAMLVEMKTDYERRIADLEDRLAAAERKAAQAEKKSETATQRSVAAEDQADKAAQQVVALNRKVEATPAPSPAPATSTASPRNTALTSASAFNPRMSVILDGNYYNDGIGGEGAALVGEAFQPEVGHGHDEEGHDDHGHEHGGMSNGFNFREAELWFSATVDPYFDATTMIVVDGDGNVDLEEAWFQTRNLPYGLKVKGGKFLSDFGYINNRHPHQWDFVDQNLAYLNLLGDHGLQETGLQLTWLPETPVYTLLGVELGQGDQERLGVTLDGDEQEAFGLDETENGPRLWTAFAKVSPDLGDNHALQFGVSYARNNQHQGLYEFEHEEEDGDHEHEHEHEHEEEHAESGYEGSAGIWGLDVVYKFDGDGDHGHRDFKLQAEYLRSTKDTKVRSGEEDLVGRSLDFTSDGLYVQGVYGIYPKLRAGLRYDVFGLTNKVSGADDESFGSSDRWTANLTWDLSEYSRLRAQYARSDILVAPDERERFDAFYLQFLMSLGAHGAHKF